MGTSLTVHPFAALPSMAPREIPRLLINMERVGDLGTRLNDVVQLGECDVLIKQLCNELGWTDELNRLWEATADTMDKDKAKTKEQRDQEAVANKRADQDEKDAKIAAQVDAISEAIQARLKLIDEHTEEALAELAQGEPAEYEGYDEYEEWDEYGPIDDEPVSAPVAGSSSSTKPAEANPPAETKVEEAKAAQPKPESSTVATTIRAKEKESLGKASVDPLAEPATNNA